jgi:tRNA threonylcarbamoyl adenosine modification protein (Sua5/YciO/YrdC/YwlC family)
MDAEAMNPALAALRAGRLVVYPTDTLYGLGADPYAPAAMDRLAAAKGRPRDLPVSMAVGSVADLWRYGRRTAVAEAVARRHLPGPLTLLLRPTEAAPSSLVSSAGLLGLRVPDHPVSLALTRRFGPITATSANRHGGPAPPTADEAAAQLGDAVAVYVDAGPCPHGVPSTVVDASRDALLVVREGALPASALGGRNRTKGT